MSADELERTGREPVDGSGQVLDMVVHAIEGWAPESRRFAVEYENGLQLDLVIFPGSSRNGSIPRDEVTVVDKDGTLANDLTPPLDRLHARRAGQAREWVMLGWWAVSDITKYVRRDSPFEAAVDRT